MRLEPTKAEAKAWEFLKPMGFFQQFTEGFYSVKGKLWGVVLDFYHAGAKLAVEIDGPIHKRHKGHDGRRDRLLAYHDILTLRFSNADVLKAHAYVADQVREVIEERLRTKNSSAITEGKG